MRGSRSRGQGWPRVRDPDASEQRRAPEGQAGVPDRPPAPRRGIATDLQQALSVPGISQGIAAGRSRTSMCFAASGRPDQV